jgi:hypothetical protein
MTRLDREARVTIKALVSRGASNAAVARLRGVSEGSVRYHVTRMAAGTVDGRGAVQGGNGSGGYCALAAEPRGRSGQSGAVARVVGCRTYLSRQLSLSGARDMTQLEIKGVSCHVLCDS